MCAERMNIHGIPHRSNETRHFSHETEAAVQAWKERLLRLGLIKEYDHD